MVERWGVSGVSGFCGSHLKSSLEQLGHEVIPITRSGFVPPKLDRLVDFAAYGNISTQTDAIMTYQANVIRVIDILNQCKGIKSIILTSTSSVDLPYQTLYSASKKAMEEVAQINARDKELPIIIARPFSVYGPGEQKEHLIPKLIDSCLNGTEMPFVGEPVHDFIYIDDFINQIVSIANTNPPPGIIYNIGSGISYSNEEVKNIVEKVTGKKANLKQVESMRKYDTKDWPTSNMMTNTSLEEGIRRMVNEQTK